MKKGFTLVELSIVLVIIGLLIGGILVAQSMISAARVTKATEQIGKYEIALQNFKQVYNQIPGDSNMFTPPGNNNKSSNDVLANCANEREYMNSFAHLSQAYMLDDRFVPVCNSTVSTTYSNTNNAGVVFGKLSGSPVFYGNHLSRTGDKPYFQIWAQFDNGKMSFILGVAAEDTIALESKMSAKQIVPAYQAGGLANDSGPGMCYRPSTFSYVLCTFSPSNTYGMLTYYINLI